MPALEATTPEINKALQQRSLDPEGSIKTILETADMVKFAKAVPPAEVHPQALQQVRAFVLETRKPAPDITAEDEEKAAEE